MGTDNAIVGFAAWRFLPQGIAQREISKVWEVVAASGSKKVRKAENVDSEGSDGQACTDLGIMGARLAATVPQRTTPTPARLTSQRAIGHD